MLDTLNRLLGVLNERMQRSRDALGNLAHALKRPLSLLQQDIAGLPEAQKLRGELQDSTSRIRTIIERELQRARIAGNAMGGEHFVPARDLPELAELMRRLYPAVRVEHRVVSECGPAAFDREDMLELLGNLLDNACKWAAGEVLIELRCADEMILTVSDDGPGIPPDQVQGLLRRGARLDEQVEGHGLGLSIISGIVESYDGRIAVEAASPDGRGTRIRVRLPTGK
jgi:signal transduction histidine kinase